MSAIVREGLQKHAPPQREPARRIMKFHPEIHHRRSIRLQGYDYSRAGAYFVTICVQGRECLFGEIADGIMVLNKAGEMVDQWWRKLPEKFPNARLDQYSIMPNHFHGIIWIVGADPCDRPGVNGAGYNQGGHAGPPLPTMVQWFKTMTTHTPPPYQ